VYIDLNYHSMMIIDVLLMSNLHDIYIQYFNSYDNSEIRAFFVAASISSYTAWNLLVIYFDSI